MSYLSYSIRTTDSVLQSTYPSSLPSSAGSSRQSTDMAFSPTDATAMQSSSMQRSSSSDAYTFSSAMRQSSVSTPNAYVSDADLFGDDDAPYLSEPPSPPRSAEAWAQAVAKPLLPPVVNIKPRACSNASTKKKRRTSSSASKASKG